MERWEKFEHYCREILGLAGTPGSGNQWHDKGDGTTRAVYDPWPLQIDAKTTIGKTFSINRSQLEDWIDQATSSGRRFAMPVRFLANARKPDYDFVVIDFNDFAELVDLAREKKSHSFTEDDLNIVRAFQKQAGTGLLPDMLGKIARKIEALL